MNWASALRGFIGVVLVVAGAVPGPAAATSGSTSHQSADIAGQAILTASACSPGARACPIRISFGRGAYSGQAHSQLLGIRSQRWFVVHARAGQTMIVIVEGRGPTRGVVSFPDGRSSGQPGGRVFDTSVPATGDYRVRVSESPMGEAWSGRVDVVVVIY